MKEKNMQKKGKSPAEKKINFIEWIVNPLIVSILTTVLLWWSGPAWYEIVLYFTVSFFLFLMVYIAKKMCNLNKTCNMKTGGMKRKFIQVILKTIVFATGLSVYIMIFLYGKDMPLVDYSAEFNTLIIYLDTAYVLIGIWAFIFLTSYAMSKFEWEWWR